MPTVTMNAHLTPAQQLSPPPCKRPCLKQLTLLDGISPFSKPDHHHGPQRNDDLQNNDVTENTTPEDHRPPAVRRKPLPAAVPPTAAARGMAGLRSLEDPLFLQSGCLLQQSYSIRGCLREDLMGRNAGRIFSGYRNCDWKPVVIKLVRDVEELRLQRLCAHPGVVEVIAAYRDPRIKGRVYRRSIAVVLEFCGQGDLLDLVSGSPGGVLPAETVRDVAKQCLETLAHLHSLGCCHRDIKPDNVFLSRMADGRLRTKLGDFEFATDEADITKSLHTLQYMAPEVYDNYQNHRLTYTNACDVWSLGATLYVSICGHFPFKFSGKTIATLTDTDVGTLRAGKVRFSGPFWDNVAPDLKALVSAMMTPDANERPTAEECLRRMSEAARNSDGTF